MKLYGYRADGTPLKTQWETILYHLQTTGETITQWQAIRDFGFTRLSGIVKTIEYRRGIVLERRGVQVETRYGGKTHITEYWYKDGGDNH